MRAWIVAGWLCVACGTPAAQPAPTSPAPPAPSGSGTPMEKTPNETSKASFERGVALTPADKLLTWIEAQKRGTEPRLLRLPIVMAKGQVGFSLRGAKLGTAGDAIEVNLNDSALGIGLGMKSRKCKTAVCAFLVEAYWRGKDDTGGNKLAVVKAGEPLSDADLAAITHAEVEGESGN
ncbi:MAG: hypothetical protein ABI867_13475 [Kofleriaceae bacterium]